MFVLATVTLLNTTPVFARAAQDVPVLGGLCRVFTFRHYDFYDETKVINVTVPQIENTGNSELENRINLEISKMIAREVDAPQSTHRNIMMRFLQQVETRTNI